MVDSSRSKLMTDNVAKGWAVTQMKNIEKIIRCQPRNAKTNGKTRWTSSGGQIRMKTRLDKTVKCDRQWIRKKWIAHRVVYRCIRGGLRDREFSRMQSIIAIGTAKIFDRMVHHSSRVNGWGVSFIIWFRDLLNTWLLENRMLEIMFVSMEWSTQ